MLPQFVKFAASTVLIPARRAPLSGALQSRHGLTLANLKLQDNVAQSTGKSGVLNTIVYKEPDNSSKFNGPKKSVKVTILGANGAVGQMLSVFLKQCPLIHSLTLYDITPTSGTAVDISHIDTSCKVFAYNGKEQLHDALKGSDIVVNCAGVPVTPSMPKGYMFYKNGEIVFNLVKACAEACPKALIGILTDPINSMMPIAVEVLKNNDTYESNRVFGIAASHVVRASTFVAERMSLDPTSVIVPVTGGCSSTTVVPVLSQTKPSLKHSSSFFSEEVFTFLVNRIRSATGDVIRAKKMNGAPSLLTAYSAARFTHSLAKGLCGKQAIEWAYVSSKVIPHCPFLINPVELGINGIERNRGLPKLTKFESNLLDKAIPQIVNDIKQGQDFVSFPPLEYVYSVQNKHHIM